MDERRHSLMTKIDSNLRMSYMEDSFDTIPTSISGPVHLLTNPINNKSRVRNKYCRAYGPKTLAN